MFNYVSKSHILHVKRLNCIIFENNIRFYQINFFELNITFRNGTKTDIFVTIFKELVFWYYAFPSTTKVVLQLHVTKRKDLIHFLIISLFSDNTF